MRILYYSAHPNLNLSAPTGYGRHMRETIAAMRRAGHEVQVLIMGGTEMKIGNTVPQTGSQIKSLLRKIIPGFIWRTAREYKLLRFDDACQIKLQEVTGQFKPDLIYERCTWLQDSGSRVTHKNKIRYIVEVNAPFEEEVKSFEDAGSMYAKTGSEKLREVLFAADRVVTVSGALSQYLIDRYGAEHSRIIIVPNGVHPPELKIDDQLQRKLRNEIVPTGERIIGFVGSIFPYHGVDILIDAFSAFLISGHRDWKLLIVGDGYLVPELKQRAVDLGVADHIVFTGPVEPGFVFTYISIMDICVMAKSNWYGSPVKIFEYGYAGKPIIAPDVAPVREVIEDGVDGYIVIPSADAVEDAFNKISSDLTAAMSIGEHFKRKVEANYTWDIAINKILS